MDDFCYDNIAPIQKLQSHDLSDITCGWYVLKETVPIDLSITMYPLSKPCAFGSENCAERWLKMASQAGLQVILVNCITVTSVICGICVTFLSRFCNPVLC